MSDRRLLRTRDAAHYLSLSAEAIRLLVDRGQLVPVRLPSTRADGERARPLFFDIRDLDDFVDRLKAEAAQERR
jgi:hypothetical protein